MGSGSGTGDRTASESSTGDVGDKSGLSSLTEVMMTGRSLMWNVGFSGSVVPYEMLRISSADA